ncbi:hypothetical protein HHI36_008723 [Cryptolaemus montrouzieri]|uniref:Uncharacterized protein n=1 Tax=Cryptolaemus montrouzieri TaxID=559131 RepID=A0ABD2MTT7_9CUCU
MEKKDGKRWIMLISACGLTLLGLGCFYTLVRTFKNINVQNQSTFEAQKLIRPIPINEDGKEEFPRPFGMAFKEPVPSVFRASSTTEKITTISYPQIAKYRHNYQPRNIQDILRYTAPMLKAKTYERMHMDGLQNQYSTARLNQYGVSHNQYSDSQNQNFGFNQLPSNHDPFYAYKPQDPSDINLMATANVRFAPPPWKNMNKHFNKMYPNHQPEHPDFVRDKFGRPLIVTLNIFPMTEKDKIMMSPQYQGQINLFGKMMANKEFEGPNGNNMIIRLNLFPEALSSLNIGRHDESE